MNRRNAFSGKTLFAIISALLLSLCEADSQTGLPPEAIRLAAVKQKMAGFLSRMPDYTCVETIDRSLQKSKSEPIYLADRLRLDIAFIGNKEVYSWPGAKSFEEKRLADLVGNGMVSDGDFAMHTGSLFTRDGAQIRFAGDELLAGNKASRYDYVIPSLSSSWNLRSASNSGRVGTRGSFWIDPDGLGLLRVELDAQDIPAELKIDAVHVKIGYAKVRVHGEDISIPKTADTLLDEAAGPRNINHVEFTECREYRVQSVISFDSAGETSASKAGTLEAITIPPALLLPLRLDQAIDSDTAAEGDLITAKTDRSVKSDNTVLIPRGATVRGRIRRMQKFDEQSPHFALSIEWTSIEFNRKIGDIKGTLERIAPAARTPVSLVPALGPANIPGVGTLRITGKHFHLDQNLEMQWRTIALTH